MGDLLVQGFCCRVAGPPTFFPGAVPDQNHAMVTLMTNRKTRSGKEVTDEVTANFWGKNASIAANYLYTGKEVNIRGRLVSYRQPTGVIGADQREKINRRVEIVVSRVNLLSDSSKYNEQKLAESLARMIAEGRLPAAAVLTLADIFPKKSSMVEFNPQLAAQTGKFGYARVWSKDRGFWAAGETAAPTGNLTDAQILQQIQALQSQLGSASPAPVVNANAGVANPF